jgi:hypothetical protein
MDYTDIANEGDALRKRGQWKDALDRLWSVAGGLGAALDEKKLPDPVFVLLTDDLLTTIEMGVLVYRDSAQPERAVRLLRDAAKRAHAAAKRCPKTERGAWNERAKSFEERAGHVEHFERDQLAAVRDLQSLSPPSRRVARLFARRLLQLPAEDLEDSFEAQVLRACTDAIGPDIESGAVDLSELLVRDGERIIAVALRVTDIWQRHPLIRI